MKATLVLLFVTLTIILSIPVINIVNGVAPVSNNPEFNGTTIENMFNQEENILCEDPQIYPNSECFVAASVQFESNNTAILQAHSKTYSGAAITLMKQDGWTLEQVLLDPDGYIIYFSK